jgi:hypothetical protein
MAIFITVKRTVFVYTYLEKWRRAVSRDTGDNCVSKAIHYSSAFTKAICTGKKAEKM